MFDKKEKLQSLYSSLESLKNSGEDVVRELKIEINNLELELLKDEIIPSVMSVLCNYTHELHCQIDLSCQSDGEGHINYSFCKSGSKVLVRDSVDLNNCQIQPDENHSKELSIDNNEIFDFDPNRKIRIVNYSERSFAVYGNTRGYQKFLKNNGGCFNSRLSEGPGWIFSNHRLEVISKFFGEKIEDNSNSEIHNELEKAQIPALPKITSHFNIFKITYPNGIVDSPQSHLEAYVNFLRYVGPNRLKSLNIVICGANFISKKETMIPRYEKQYKNIGGEYFANTICTTQRKLEIMTFISKKLHLGVDVKLIPTERSKQYK